MTNVVNEEGEAKYIRDELHEQTLCNVRHNCRGKTHQRQAAAMRTYFAIISIVVIRRGLESTANSPPKALSVTFRLGCVALIAIALFAQAELTRR